MRHSSHSIIVSLLLMVCVLLSITVVAFGVVGATTDWGNNATPKTDDKPLQESNSSDMSAQESSDSFTEMYSSNENGSNEILFNDIPYGARYNEVIPVLEKKFNVKFQANTRTENDFPMSRVENLKWGLKFYEAIPFSIATGFRISSQSLANVAGFKAKITLIFLYDNDGSRVKNADIDIDSSIFVSGIYQFYSKWDRPYPPPANIEGVTKVDTSTQNKMREELGIKLQSIYGPFDTNNYGSIQGAEQTELHFEYGENSIAIRYETTDEFFDGLEEENLRIMKSQLTSESIRQKDEHEKQIAQYEEEVKNGDNSGL